MLVSAAISRGPPYRLLISWARDRFEMVVSLRLLYELEAVLLLSWFQRKLTYEEVLEYVLCGQVRGQTVSATATNLLDATGDTSEFSKNKAISTVP